MAYDKQNWSNGGNFGRYAPGATEMSAERFQHIEDGLEAVALQLDALASGLTFIEYFQIGSGSPEGVVTAGIGEIYLRTDGFGAPVYAKRSGEGNTGWAPLAPVGSEPVPEPPSVTAVPITEYGFNEGAGFTAYDLALATGSYNLTASSSTASWTSSTPKNGAYSAKTQFTGFLGPNVVQQNYTIMFWARREGTWTNYASMLANPAQGIWIEAHSAASYVPNFYAGNNQAVGTTAMALNTWVHIAVTRDSTGKTQIFVNGTLEGSSNGNVSAQNFGGPGANGGTGTYAIAANAATAQDESSWNGSIDDFRVFDSVLDATAITTWMNTPITAVGGPADPINVPGVLNRWRADSVALGDLVAASTWPAMTGAVAQTQATSANQPTYYVSGINGKPALRFTTDDWMAATITGDTAPVSYVVVLKPNSVGAYQTIIHNGVEIQLQNSAGTTWEMWGGSANLRGGTPTTDPVVITAISDTTDSLYVNGTLVASGAAGTLGASTVFTTGRHPVVGRPLDAYVGEEMLVDHALTAAERSTIHTYAQDYWSTSVSDYGGVPPASTSDNGFGMMVFLDKSQPTVFDQDLAALVQTGSTWIRIGLPANVIGSYSGTTYTPDVAGMNYVAACCQKARAAGLKVVLVIADTDRGATASLTEAQYRTYVGQFFGYVSQRCGQYVDLWQLWNEFDVRDYRTYAPITLSAAYLDRFRLALAAGRTAVLQYSSAPVTTTPFGYPVNAARYTQWTTFFDGIHTSLDVIGVHGYPETSTTVINLLATYLNNLETRYSKPVAVLEFGVPNVSGYGTPTQVGAAIVNQINAIMGTTPMVATLYQLRDRGAANSTNGEDVFGIIENNFTKKSYWQAVVNAIAAL